MATWKCPGCPTACELKIPLQLPDLKLPSIPIPKIPPEIKMPKLPKIPKIPMPPFDFSKLCPSSGRED